MTTDATKQQQDVRVDIGQWTFTVDNTRYIKVWHAETLAPVDLLSLRGYDGPMTPDVVRSRAEIWVECAGAAFQRELPYLK